MLGASISEGVSKNSLTLNYLTNNIVLCPLFVECLLKESPKASRDMILAS